MGRLIQHRSLILSICIVAAAGVGVAACSRTPAPVVAVDSAEGLVGKPAPELSVSLLDGKKVSLSDYKGQVVLVDFWATWCGPCVKSLPHVDALAKNADFEKKGLKVLAMSVDNEPEKVKEFLGSNNLTLPVAVDADGAASSSYHVTGIPLSVVVARDGTVARVLMGASPDELDTAVAAAIDAK